MFKSPANFLQSCKKSRAWISSREEIQESRLLAHDVVGGSPGKAYLAALLDKLYARTVLNPPPLVRQEDSHLELGPVLGLDCADFFHKLQIAYLRFKFCESLVGKAGAAAYIFYCFFLCRFALGFLAFPLCLFTGEFGELCL